MPRREPPFSERAARLASERSDCWAEALRQLGYRSAGHNPRTLQRHARRWGIPTDHFDPNAARRRSNSDRRVPLGFVLVERSTYSRCHLKARLFEEGLKQRRCEICGQEESWRGRDMSLVLDHINGVADDNRIQNLRILCPNCAATLETHCGRKIPRSRTCPGCGRSFAPNHLRHRYCSPRCVRYVPAGPEENPSNPRGWGIPRAQRRRINRPPYEELLEEIERLGYRAVGRKHGVSDNAIRKWVAQYRRELALAQAAREPEHSRSDPDRR